MSTEKLQFLQAGVAASIKDLDEKATARFGLMNAQQMLEHLADFFEVSYEKIIFPLSVPEEHLPKYREFLYSDKQFRENTKAPSGVLGDMPLPLRQASFAAARQHLQGSVDQFIAYFRDEPAKKTLHPAFGYLNFDEWVLLHYKHVMHHLRQFDLVT